MATPEIEQATTFTAIIGTTPVIIVLSRFRSVHIAESGTLFTADAWTTALLEHGAQPMLDTDFLGDPAQDWTDIIGPGLTPVRVTGPAGLGEIYSGGVEADTAWRERVAGLHHIGAGLVVISGPADQPTPDAAQQMMESERRMDPRPDSADQLVDGLLRPGARS
ncbi:MULTISPECIES: hypothetical protein [Nocardia]|uniref:hypothetical protein n=1 Tax=Nocardia TaxID=1817 RepID=UPI001300AB54|nr:MULTISPECIES: hypothetical protein [Nocardia]